MPHLAVGWKYAPMLIAMTQFESGQT